MEDKRALIHGFGAIGRGFLAEVFRRNGYQIVGIDPAKPRNDRINERGGYDIIIEADKVVVERVDHVKVVDARDAQAVKRAYMEANIAGLALLPEAVPAAARDIAASLVARHEARRLRLALLVALNRLDGGPFVTDAIRRELEKIAPGRAEQYLQGIQVIETVILRMARNPRTEEPDETAVYTEPVFNLLARNGAPILAKLKQVQLVDELRPYEEMKLFLSNCAHAVVAYQGYQKGHRTIAKALADPEIRRHAEAVLGREAGPAVIAKWGLPPEEVGEYCSAVLTRFANPRLEDEVVRVARNPIRKLSKEDRLIGPARLALQHGIEPEHLSKAIAGALKYDAIHAQDLEPAEVQAKLANAGDRGVRAVLEDISGLKGAADEHLMSMVERDYSKLSGTLEHWKAMPSEPTNEPRVFLTGVPNPMELRAKLGQLGIDLDLRTGHISYRPDFKPLDLGYRLTFVRHGQTFANREPRHFQGQVDEAKNQLNAKGLCQAKEAAEKLGALCRGGWLPDVIYTSPLTRAHDTAEPFLEASGLRDRAQVLDGIKEMSFGQWDNRRVDSFATDDRCHLFYQQQNALVKGVGGENFAELLFRAKATLESLSTEHRGQEVLMFSHSMFGAACAILTGHGQKAKVGHLGFDGPYIFPHAEPVALGPKIEGRSGGV